MKILIVGRFYADAFALHIAETLEDLGHRVERYEAGAKVRTGGRLGHWYGQVRALVQSATDSIPSLRAARVRALWKTVDRGAVDVILVCHDFLAPREVRELKRRTGAVVALWFPDALVNFHRGFFMNAPYDALFFKDPYIVSALGGYLRSPVFYLPECFNPARHCADEAADVEFSCDIATAGNLHSYRAAVFAHLADYRVKMWGPPPPVWLSDCVAYKMHQGRQVWNADKALAFRSAKIVLNNLHYGEIWGLNARAFEAAGVGVFQLLDFRPALADLFRDGEEVVSFRGLADLREKLSYWLPRDAERRRIAEAGKQRAHRDHTYKLRLTLLLDTLGGREKGFHLPAVHR